MKNVEQDFIVTMPTWEDSNGYRIMESIPDIQIKKLNPHQYNYNQGDKKINATFPSTIFSRCIFKKSKGTRNDYRVSIG